MSDVEQLTKLVSYINNIGIEYLDKYPKSGFYLSGFGWHSHQQQATKLKNFVFRVNDSLQSIFSWLYNDVMHSLIDSNGYLGGNLLTLFRMYLPDDYARGFTDALTRYSNSTDYMPTNKEIMRCAVALLCGIDANSENRELSERQSKMTSLQF